jgi:hypothetical protein
MKFDHSQPTRFDPAFAVVALKQKVKLCYGTDGKQITTPGFVSVLDVAPVNAIKTHLLLSVRLNIFDSDIDNCRECQMRLAFHRCNAVAALDPLITGCDPAGFFQNNTAPFCL